MGLTIKCFEDNEPLKRMTVTKGLLWVIRQVRDARLDLDDSRMVKAAAFALADRDLFELVNFLRTQPAYKRGHAEAMAPASGGAA